MDRIPRLGTFNVPGQTQTANTAIFAGIPPYPGPAGNPPTVYALPPQGPNWITPGNGGAMTHVSRLDVTTGSTLHLIYILRPLNYTTTAAAVAKNATTIVLTADPGVYSTAGTYKYPLAGGLTSPAGVADNAIATNDYVAYQLADGTWLFQKITNVSTLTITVAGTPNVTGATVAAGAPVFWFGAAGDSDPATGFLQPTFEPPVSVTSSFTDPDSGVVSSLHPGDPMLFYDANATGADTLVHLSGFYGRF